MDNVLLAPTLPDLRDGGTGRGAGFNELYLAYTVLPADAPSGRTLVRQLRHLGVRYPVGGIKSPPDGLVRVLPEHLVDRCTPGAPSP